MIFPEARRRTCRNPDNFASIRHGPSPGLPATERHQVRRLPAPPGLLTKCRRAAAGVRREGFTKGRRIGIGGVSTPSPSTRPAVELPQAASASGGPSEETWSMPRRPSGSPKDIESLGYGSLFIPRDRRARMPLGRVDGLSIGHPKRFGGWGPGIANIHVRIPAGRPRTRWPAPSTQLFPRRFMLGLGVSHGPLVLNTVSVGTLQQGHWRPCASNLEEDGRAVPRKALRTGVRRGPVAGYSLALGPKMIRTLREPTPTGAHPYFGGCPNRPGFTAATSSGPDNWGGIRGKPSPSGGTPRRAIAMGRTGISRGYRRAAQLSPTRGCRPGFFRRVGIWCPGGSDRLAACVGRHGLDRPGGPHRVRGPPSTQGGGPTSCFRLIGANPTADTAARLA